MTCSRLESSFRIGLFSCVFAAVGGIAAAQEPAAPPVAPPTLTSEPQPPLQVSPAPAPVEPAAPLPPPPGVMEPPPPIVEGATPLAEAAPAEEPAETPWYANFKIGGYVDAYGAIRSDKNSRPVSVPIGGYYHEAYVQDSGFALAFAGLDATYTGEKFGATINLRFGPGVSRFYAANMSDFGIENLTQAYVTYKPIEQLTFDLGQFGTIYGAEVLESWKNINYSRGALYYAMQPFWHTGLRANIAISDAFALNALVVNGVNNVYDDNKAPSLGLQAAIKPNDNFSLSIGYLGELNPRKGEVVAFQNFFDVVATIKAGGFTLLINGDLNLYKLDGADAENFWGISVAPSYAFNDMFGVGFRFEHLQDSANLFGMRTGRGYTRASDGDTGEETLEFSDAADKATLTTLTLTLDIKPIPSVTAVILRPEFRYEIASNYYYFKNDTQLSKGFWTLMLGAVVTSL